VPFSAIALPPHAIIITIVKNKEVAAFSSQKKTTIGETTS
jgi:hypothetical protein